MYHLPQYKEQDNAVVIAFMKAHPFAMLIGADQQQPVATQIPVMIKERDGRLFIQGHFMKQTDHHKAFETNKQALVVFTGPHTYISASWYSNQQQASTWNYMSVHARGELQFLGDEQLLNMLDELTAHFENNPDSPSLYQHLPQDYINRLVKAIVAFEIPVTDLQHVFKLSQNRDPQSHRQIIERLKQGDADARAIAAEMEKRSS